MNVPRRIDDADRRFITTGFDTKNNHANTHKTKGE
jgi:hypothetical protein